MVGVGLTAELVLVIGLGLVIFPHPGTWILACVGNGHTGVHVFLLGSG